jgi:hypothetical protein
MIHKNNTSDNLNIENSNIKNIKDSEKNINNNLVIDNLEIINSSNDIYSKIQPKKLKIIEISEKDLKKDNQNNVGVNDNKINNINNFKKYIKTKLIDYNSMKKNIEDFCEILEQFYFISFKKSFIFFIQNLIAFNKNKKTNRAIILRRFNDGKKSNKTNNIKLNNSMININNNKNNIKISENIKLRTIDNDT